MDIDSACLWLSTRDDKSLAAAKDLGVSRELLNGSAKSAWDFVVEYRRKHGEIPGPTAIAEKTGMVVHPVEDDDRVTLSYVVDLLRERLVYKGLTYGLGETSKHMEQGDQSEAVAAVLKLSDFLRKETVQSVRVRTLAEVASEVLAQYQAIKRGEIGVPFPWPTMTKMTMGMWPGTLTFFVARPGVGKTWCACICAMECWRAGLKVLVIEPEMSRVELGERLLCLEGRYSYAQMISATLGDMAEKHMTTLVDELKVSATNFYILDDEDKLNSDGIDQAVDAIEPDLLVVDSVYMVRAAEGKLKKGAGSGGGSRYDRILATVDWLRSLSRRKKIPVLAVSQLAREGKVRKGAAEEIKSGQGTGGLEDALAMTDTILWDVHNLFAVWQDDDMRVDKQLMFVPLKARRRVVSSALVIGWDMETMTFEEIGTSVPGSEKRREEEGFGRNVY